MSDNNLNKMYTAEDIEKYFSGSLLPAQMHAMEKAAVEDPFLAEAMEGFEMTASTNWKPQLDELHQHFNEGAGLAKVIPMKQAGYSWWKMAAAILLIGGGATLTYVLTKTTNTGNAPQTIAQHTTVTYDSSESKSGPVTPLVVPPVATNDESKKINLNNAENVPGTKRQVAAIKPLINPDSTLLAQKDDAQFLTKINTENNTPTGIVDKVNVNTSTSTPSMNNSVGDEKSMAEAIIATASNEEQLKKKQVAGKSTAEKIQPLNNNFAAQIVGPDNTPLPFSNISIKSENFGTYADVKGNFRLVSTDSLLNIEVRSVGYLPKTYTLRSNQAQNKIILVEDEITKKDMTVMKRKQNNQGVARKATLLKDVVANVEPADGWDNYNTYISNNIEIPEELLKNNQHVEISISFEVKANGKISNVQIDPSSCNKCEELAKRLIEQGPQWKLKKGKKATARIKVQY